MIASLAVAAQAQPAAADISFDGIGTVQLNMSEAAVRDALGRPSSSRPFAGPEEVVIFSYRRDKLEVTVHRGRDRVVVVRTKSRAQKTSSGLGVGSPDSVVRRKLRGESCGEAHGTRVCSVDRGGAVIEFDSRHGKVVAVAVLRGAT